MKTAVSLLLSDYKTYRDENKRYNNKFKQECK